MNGHAVADYLADHAKVSRGLLSWSSRHPQHDLAKRQMSGFGALITFEAGSLDNANSDVTAGSGYAPLGNRWAG